jgi:hypothetical protein
MLQHVNEQVIQRYTYIGSSKARHNSRNKTQARNQNTITSMITTCKHNNDHKFPSYSLQELKKKHRKPQD